MNKRKIVYEKSSGICCICGCRLHIDKNSYNSNEYAQIDHIHPKSLGGRSNIDNLRALCKSCNSKRMNRSGEKLISTIVNSINNSNIETNQRLMFLQDDYNNGLVSDKKLEMLKEKIKSVAESNVSAINGILGQQ